MSTLPLLLILFVAHVLAGSDGSSLGIGNTRHGFDLIMAPNPPQSCTPLRIWYNLTIIAGKDVSLPGDAAIKFFTPESSMQLWMTLKPQIGAGILSWIVPLRPGKQFVIQNSDGFEQAFTVSAGTGTCDFDAAQVTSSSIFGELNTNAFNRLRSETFSTFSFADNDKFRRKDFPSGSFTVQSVSLGAAIPSTSDTGSGQSPENPQQNTGSGEASDGDTGGTGDASNGSDASTGSNGLDSSGDTTNNSNNASSTPLAQQSEDNSASSSNLTGSSSSTTPNQDSPSNNKSQLPSDANNESTSGGSGSSGTTSNPTDSQTTGSSYNKGAIIGGIAGALFAGVLLGLLGVWLNRRRRRQRSRPVLIGVSPLPPPMGEAESSRGGAASGIASFASSRASLTVRKDAKAFENDGITSRRMSTGVTTAERQSYFGGMSDYPATEQVSDTVSEASAPRAGNFPPPQYSRFA
ncbi:hypothetical protein BKA62DRAFT_697627 [Auriculariales sp. MPI-PUGE-AT-0066]|nr:hypothetical protein BKA62DRAFT_697627 [Auriculariales sp. MPI-PUGE-AT-0066]